MNKRTNSNNDEDHQNNSDGNRNSDHDNDHQMSSSSSHIYRRINTIEDLQAREEEGKSHPDPQLKLVDSFSSSSVSSSSGSGGANEENENEDGTTESASTSMSMTTSTENQEREMLLLHHYSTSSTTTSNINNDIIRHDSTMSSVTATTVSTMYGGSGDDSNHQCEEDNSDTPTVNRKGRRCFNKDKLSNSKKNSQAALLRASEKERKMKEAEEELAKRAQKRQMTSTQELWNALTMIVAPIYCLHYCLTSAWLSQADISNASSYFFGENLDLKAGSEEDDLILFNSSLEQQQQHQLEEEQIMKEWASSSASCIHSSFLPNLHSLPPLTIISMTIACCLHSPCSMYYHLLCAYKLPPGPKRMDHWARRLDQAMIHVMSFMYGYATSANTDYLLVAMAFNIDSMYRLFQKGMRPKRTLYRMILAFLIPVLPILLRGEILNFLMLLTIYSISGWLFSAYPLGGWSHCAFHLVVCFSNPILIRASLHLDAAVVRDSIDLAAKCFFIEQNGYGVAGDTATNLVI